MTVMADFKRSASNFAPSDRLVWLERWLSTIVASLMKGSVSYRVSN